MGYGIWPLHGFLVWSLREEGPPSKVPRQASPPAVPSLMHGFLGCTDFWSELDGTIMQHVTFVEILFVHNMALLGKFLCRFHYEVVARFMPTTAPLCTKEAPCLMSKGTDRLNTRPMKDVYHTCKEPLPLAFLKVRPRASDPGLGWDPFSLKHGYRLRTQQKGLVRRCPRSPTSSKRSHAGSWAGGVRRATAAPAVTWKKVVPKDSLFVSHLR